MHCKPIVEGAVAGMLLFTSPAAKQPDPFLMPLRAAPTHLSRVECIKDALRRIFIVTPPSEELLNRRARKLLNVLDDGHEHNLSTWWDIVFYSELAEHETVAQAQVGIEPAADDWKANVLEDPTRPDRIKSARACRQEVRELRRLRREARELRPLVEAIGCKWNPDAWPSLKTAIKEMRKWVEKAGKAETAPGES